MPYAEVGVVKNATKDVVAGIEFSGNDITLKVYTTSVFTKIKIALLNDKEALFQEIKAVSPEKPYTRIINKSESFTPEDITLVISNIETNKILLTYRQEKKSETPIPPPAKAVKRPQEVESNEQLFLKDLHIEQYRHATYVAKDYYEEALRRDANDIRNNNVLGLWYLNRAKFAESEPYFRTAIATLSLRNPNPYDGEPYYNLGWLLKLQGKNEEAFDAFYKNIWNDAWQHAGYLNLARIATGKQDYEEAKTLIEKSILRNYHSHTAHHLKAVILRKLDQQEEAFAIIKDSLKIDPFNYSCLFEKYLWWQQANQNTDANEFGNQLKEISRNWVHNFIEYALNYFQAGLFQEAAGLLLFHINDTNDQYPMLYYYLG